MEDLYYENHLEGGDCQYWKQENDKTTLSDEEFDYQDCYSEVPEPIYAFAYSDALGRYMIANRDILPGETIIMEPPFISGPSVDFECTCIGCYKPLEEDLAYKCKRCHWTLCGADCPGYKQYYGHSREECSLLRKYKVSELFNGLEKTAKREMYECLMPLRCLLLKEHDPEKWERLMDMESHSVKRKDTVWWYRDQKVVVNRLRNEWKLTQFSEEEIHLVCGIVEINCFQTGDKGAKGRAIYNHCCLLAHSCAPNTAHMNYAPRYDMWIRSSREIKKGEAITLSYCYRIESTMKRRQSLIDGKFFWCVCERCADPTEFGSYLSAFKCPKCPGGFVLPKDSLDVESVWLCSHCIFSVPAKLIVMLDNALHKEVRAIPQGDLETMEKYLERYTWLLHKNNYLFVMIKYNLAMNYGHRIGYKYDQISLAQLKRKVQYCRDVLEVQNLLDPGLARIKGQLCFELHESLMSLAMRLMNSHEITKIEFGKLLLQSKKALQESVSILSLEPENSPEYPTLSICDEISDEIDCILRAITKLI